MNLFALAGLSVGISSLLVSAITVYFGKTRTHHLLLLFNVVVAVWGFGLFLVGIAPSESKAILGWKIANIGGFFVGPSFYHMASHLCERPRRKLLCFAYLQAAVFVALGFGTDLIFNRTIYIYDIYFQVMNPWYLGGFSLYLVLVAMGYYELFRFLKISKGRKRNQTRYIIFSFSLGFIGATTSFLPMFGLEIIYPAGNFGIVIYTIVLAFAIYRHHLLDINIIFKKTLVYSLSAGLLTGLFLLLILGLTTLFTVTVGRSSFAVTIVAAMIIVLLLDPLKQKIQSFLDRMFYKTTYDYFAAIQNLGRELAITTDLESTYRFIVDSIFSLLKLKNVCLLSESNEYFQPVYSRSSGDNKQEAYDKSRPVACLARGSRLVRLLAEKGDIVVQEDSQADDIEAERDELAAIRGEVVIPVVIDDQLAVIIVLGEKLSGDTFTAEDFNLLETVASQSAIAIRNARLYSELESRVELRTRDLAAANKKLEESRDQIHQLAYNDFLTGLPNRIMFNDFLSRALARARRYNELLALLFIDLDDFKRVNDTLGHESGDLLLKQVAARMLQATRKSDFVSRSFAGEEDDLIARLGGDEFTVVLPNIKLQDAAAVVASRLLRSLTRPFMLKGHEIYITVSIGITIFPADAEHAGDLIKNADIAMYKAKGKGKNNYQYYTAAMNVAALERLTMEGELRQALERNEFVLHYQPQVDCLSREVVGLEALIRWQHPTKGMMPPGQFIPIAEESELIVLIGEWVLRSAAQQISTWRAKGIRNVPVAVNLSGPQFQNRQIVTVISSIIAENDIEPASLKVELTERILIRFDEREVMDILDSIKSMGVQICLDDFGTGYSSLNYLKQLPIDVLKIDRSFVKNIVSDQKDAEICSAILSLAKCLDLIVVAEGVEDREQYEFLLAKGCDLIQGFYFYKPMPAREIEQILTK